MFSVHFKNYFHNILFIIIIFVTNQYIKNQPNQTQQRPQEREGGGGGSFPLQMGIELRGETKEGMQPRENPCRGPICHIMGAEVCTSVGISSLPQGRGWKTRYSVFNYKFYLPIHNLRRKLSS
jgi:hypothetical protein